MNFLDFRHRASKSLKIMISTTEACKYVQSELPQIAAELPNKENIYQTLQAFREYTCRSAFEHNYNKLQQCFSLAASLYEKGGQGVKSAVENVFVYSFSRLFTLAAEDKQKVKALIPASLLALYMNQVLHRGY